MYLKMAKFKYFCINIRKKGYIIKVRPVINVYNLDINGKNSIFMASKTKESYSSINIKKSHKLWVFCKCYL